MQPLRSDPEKPLPTINSAGTADTQDLGGARGHLRHPLARLSVTGSPVAMVSALGEHKAWKGQERLLRKGWDLEKERFGQ